MMGMRIFSFQIYRIIYGKSEFVEGVKNCHKLSCWGLAVLADLAALAGLAGLALASLSIREEVPKKGGPKPAEELIACMVNNYSLRLICPAGAG